MSRTIVTGDIHGCYEELVSLLERAHIAAADGVVAVEDLIVEVQRGRALIFRKRWGGIPHC